MAERAIEPADIEALAAVHQRLGKIGCHVEGMVPAPPGLREVAAVAGDQAEVEVLIPLGVDAHDFSPSSRQAALIAGAYTPRKGERVGVLVCGGNVDLVQLDALAR